MISYLNTFRDLNLSKILILILILSLTSAAVDQAYVTSQHTHPKETVFKLIGQ